MPDLEWNKTLWNDQYEWSESGDEWSKYWGGPRAQWYGAIFPRITRWLPAQRVLEIAPGFGRWSQFLLRQTTEFYGVDLSARCVQRCRQRFLAFDRAHFVQNDGVSLQLIEDGAIDFVFSFDPLWRRRSCFSLPATWSQDGANPASQIAVNHTAARAARDFMIPWTDPGLDSGRRNARRLDEPGRRRLSQSRRARVLVRRLKAWFDVETLSCLIRRFARWA